MRAEARGREVGWAFGQNRERGRFPFFCFLLFQSHFKNKFENHFKNQFKSTQYNENNAPI
jgi:hypothetical protein